MEKEKYFTWFDSIEKTSNTPMKDIYRGRAKKRKTYWREKKNQFEYVNIFTLQKGVENIRSFALSCTVLFHHFSLFTLVLKYPKYRWQNIIIPSYRFVQPHAIFSLSHDFLLWYAAFLMFLFFYSHAYPPTGSFSECYIHIYRCLWVALWVEYIYPAWNFIVFAYFFLIPPRKTKISMLYSAQKKKLLISKHSAK